MLYIYIYMLKKRKHMDRCATGEKQQHTHTSAAKYAKDKKSLTSNIYTISLS